MLQLYNNLNGIVSYYFSIIAFIVFFFQKISEIEDTYCKDGRIRNNSSDTGSSL